MTQEQEPQDSRRYFMVPQAPEDAGYYVYGRLDGKPSKGAYQYANATMLTAILWVEREWQLIDDRQFGVGDISLAGGPKHKDHASHRKRAGSGHTASAQGRQARTLQMVG